MTRPLEGPRPRLVAPAGATDTHMHFYWKPWPQMPGGPPPPEDATVEDYRKVQARLGIERVVIVQPNAYQLDNGCTLEALAKTGKASARAVVCVSAETGEAELQRLTDLGARGARIMGLPGGAVGLDDLPSVASRIRPFGWHPIVQLDGRDLPQHVDMLAALEGDYVIDHAGKFLEPVPVDDPAFQALLKLVDRGNCYVKLSAAYETSKVGAPGYSDVGELSKALVAHAPERMLWASNWPHPGGSDGNWPDDAELLDVLLDWAPSEDDRNKILVDNPARLYDF